jgi:hypothetical protein
MMGLGIGERTFLAGPDEVTASTTETTTSPVLVIDGKALNAYERGQTIEIAGTPTISAAYGRTEDVLAWVGDTTYTHVTYDADTASLLSTVKTGTENTVPQLAGSDLWLREFSGEATLRFRAELPENVSIIAVSDGITPAPSTVSLSWPLDNSAPWSGPLVIGGGLFLLIGLALLIWALNHMRKSRGPRRTQQKQPKMPKLPRQPRYKPKKAKAVTSAPDGKGRRVRRVVGFVPLVLVGSIALAGCSTGLTPQTTGDTPTPTSSATADPSSELGTPAVSAKQVEDIVGEIGTVVAEADTNRDNDLVATRMSGAALYLRLANYRVAAIDAAVADDLTPIPTSAAKIIVPEQTKEGVWPRRVFTIVTPETDPNAEVDPAAPAIGPTAMMLVQDDARSNYKVAYAVTLPGGVTVPDLPAADVGAARVSPDAKFLQMAPSQVAAAYADIMLKDTTSEFNDMFASENDSLRGRIGLAAQQKLLDELPKTAKESFTRVAGDAEVIAMSTLDSGAIVAVQMTETDTVESVATGALVLVPSRVRPLIGKENVTKGIVVTYSDQMLFYIPFADSTEKIQLLGYSGGLVDAKELP